MHDSKKLIGVGIPLMAIAIFMTWLYDDASLDGADLDLYSTLNFIPPEIHDIIQEMGVLSMMLGLGLTLVGICWSLAKK